MVEYDVAIEGAFGNVLVNWGHEPGWIDECREQLETAERVSLIPKEGIALPVVTVGLGDGRRWVLFSRVFGKTGTVRRVRLYCVGWQRTVRGVNTKALLWVYPGGAVECADEPSFVDRFFD